MRRDDDHEDRVEEHARRVSAEMAALKIEQRVSLRRVSSLRKERLRQQELQVLAYLTDEYQYVNIITKIAGMDTWTVRETLRRLSNAGKVENLVKWGCSKGWRRTQEKTT
jgi:hypothetical protein